MGGLGQLSSIKKLDTNAVCKDELPEQVKRRKKKISGEGSFKLPLMLSRDLESASFTDPYLNGLGRYSTLFLNLSFSSCHHLWKFICLIVCQNEEEILRFPVTRTPKSPESRPSCFFFQIIQLLLSSHLLPGLPSCFFSSGYFTSFSYSHALILSSLS